MKLARALAWYVAVVFLGAAVLAPWIYQGAQALGAMVPSLRATVQQPFHRYVNRCLLALALGGAWPLSRVLGIRSWQEAGLCVPARNGRRILTGFSIGFSSLLVVAGLSLLCGARVLHFDNTTSLLTLILGSVATAALVGMVEEVFFRGVVFGGLRKGMGVMAALLVSSGIYALVHFLERPPDPAQVSWSSGFVVLGQMMDGFAEMRTLVPGFFTLWVAGAFLALAYQRSGNLWFSIGLHAGWIFWLKLYGGLTGPGAETHLWLWGTSRMLDGWLAFLVVTATFAIYSAKGTQDSKP